MPALVHDLGLELPVFDAATPVAWTTTDIESAVNSGVDSFVRRARLEDASNSKTLKQALKVASHVLEETAYYFGADIIDYEWGLYPGYCRPDDDIDPVQCYSHIPGLTPTGYSLVAEVPVLTGARKLSDKQIHDFAFKSPDYADAMIMLGLPYVLRDISIHQLVSVGPKTVLVDIDPREEAALEAF